MKPSKPYNSYDILLEALLHAWETYNDQPDEENWDYLYDVMEEVRRDLRPNTQTNSDWAIMEGTNDKP